MNRRDRSIVTVLVLALVVIGGILAIPRAVEAPRPAATPEPTPPPAVTYREGVVGSATSITPVTARTRAERAIVGLVFSGLVKLGAGSTYQPDLAESWTTDETGKVWTFRIRDDARWQDGRPVTAADVAYTIDALKSPDAAGAGASAWADVTVEAIDPKTVALTLGTPIGSMLAAATQPLLPAHLVADIPFEDLADSEFARRPVGSGPFALESLDDTRAVLVPAYGPEAPAEEVPSAPPPSVDSLKTPYPRISVGMPGPYFGSFEVRFYPDEAGLSAAFEAGEVDAASGLSAGPLEALASLDGVDRHVYPTTTLSAVLLNLRPGYKELRDPKVRSALLRSVNRARLASEVLDGDATRADALVPPESWAFDAASADTVPFDRQGAAKALRDAGWTRKGSLSWVAPGKSAPYKLELLTVPEASNPRLVAIARFVRDAWRLQGFDVDLKMVKAADLSTRLRSGDFTAAVVDVAQGLEPDLYPLLASSQIRSGGTNFAGYQDPSLDPLLEAARKPGTPEDRMAAWKALLAGLATRMPVLPLVWNDEVVLARGLEGDTPRLIAGPGDRYWDVLAWRLAADR